MKKNFALLLTIASFAPPIAQAQTSPSPATTPAPAQVKPAPCVPPKPANPSDEVQIKPSSWLQRSVEAARKKVEKATGVTPPDVSLENIVKQVQAPQPCGAVPAKTLPPAPNPVQTPITVPVVHLPHDVVTTFLCNPVVTASDHSVSYVMPSDVTEASPTQANVFEADSVKPDPKATTACSSLHRDPKTAKFWVMQ